MTVISFCLSVRENIDGSLMNNVIFKKMQVALTIRLTLFWRHLFFHTANAKVR
jgi:hypothetical protein